ncbi:MAG: site-specific integrase [Gammaproteobacteria bacterium]
MASFLRRGDRWQAIVRRKGHKAQYRTFKRKLDAQRWANALEEQIHAGHYRPVSKTQTLAEVIAWYEATILPARAVTQTESFRLAHLRDALGTRYVGQLNARDCVDYAEARLGEAKSADTIRRELGLLSTVLTSARAFKVLTLPANPVTDAFAMIRQLRLLKAPVERDRRLRPGEEKKLVGAKLRADTQIGELIAFVLETAMRRGEVARMRRSDIDIATSTLRIWHSKTDYKTGKVGRTVPLSPKARMILASLPERGDGRVWALTDDHTITLAFSRLCKRLKITDLRFHDLRHEATSRLFERGFSIEEVATFTGHRDWRSLKRYTHPDPVRIAAKMA